MEAQVTSSKVFMEAYTGYPIEVLEAIFKDVPEKQFPFTVPLAQFEEAGISYLIFQNNDEMLLLSNKDIQIGDLCLSRYGLKPLTQEVLDKVNKPPLFGVPTEHSNRRLIHKVIFNFTKPEVNYVKHI